MLFWFFFNSRILTQNKYPLYGSYILIILIENNLAKILFDISTLLPVSHNWRI